MRLLGNLGVAVACALAFRTLYLVNDWMFSGTFVSQGVHWIFVPSGLRLILVLLFGWWGGRRHRGRLGDRGAPGSRLRW